MDEEVFTFGSLRLIPAQRALFKDGKPLRLGSRAFDILVALVERTGETVSKDELITRVWPNMVVGEAVLGVHVAALRKALGDGRAEKRYIATLSGRGYAFAAPVTREKALSATTAPTGIAEAGNLPAPLTRVVGRNEVISVLTTQLARRRFLTIVGPGGIGKTTVAVVVADRARGSYKDGVWFVGLASLSDPDLVPSAVGAALGVSPSGGDHTRVLVAWLRDRNALLVLDNCEHVIDATAALAEAILKAAPQAGILATSREPLRAEGEWLHRLAPLELPPQGRTFPTAAEALGYSAVDLFNERATATTDSFMLDDADVPAVLEICRRLDGVPLALELAAARVDTFGLGELAARLDDRFGVLTRGRRTALPRQQTLRATIDWSYDLLPEIERLLLCRLAIFPGGFTDEAAAAVMKDTDPSAVTEGIANLVAKSLIALRSDTVSRWYLLETIRAYALEKLAERGEYSAAVRRNAEYFRDLIVPVAESSTYLLSANDLARCGRELDNVRAALDWSFSPEGDATIGAALTAAFAPIWTQTLSQAVGRPLAMKTMSLASECRDRVEKMLALRGPDLGLSAALERRMFTAYGMALATNPASVEQSRAALKRAQQLSEGIEDVELHVHLLWHQWSAEMISGDYRRSLTTAQSIRELAQRSADGATRLIGDRYLGTSLLYAGRLHEARDHLQRVADHYVAPTDGRHATLFHNDQQLVARSKLAVALCLLGYLDRASEEARLSFEGALVSDPGFTLYWVLQDGQCRIALMTGDLAAADTAITAMSDCAARFDSPLWNMTATAWKGKLLIEHGEFAPGVALVRQAVDASEQPGWQICHAQFLGNLAEGLAGLGRLAEALETIERAIASAEQNGDGLFHAELIRLRGELLLRRSANTHAAEAEDCFRRANELACEQGALLWELRIAISLARLRVTQGRHNEARRFLAPVYDRYTEGFEAPDLRAARGLLDTLR